MEELHSKGLVATKLRPKPENCGIIAENIIASWTEVHSTSCLDVSFWKMFLTMCKRKSLYHISHCVQIVLQILTNIQFYCNDIY